MQVKEYTKPTVEVFELRVDENLAASKNWTKKWGRLVTEFNLNSATS